ncbi:MAG: hypothetical protein HQM13_21080 [SAR324 cluster bacterium]|nr:hypothetical protein [SAR324 cluster bacterium]
MNGIVQKRFRFPAMFKLRKLIKLLSSSQHEEIKTYKTACDSLVGKYETLLKQISEYMQENQQPLDNFEQEGQIPSDKLTENFHLNTFSLLSIKDELTHITHECEDLLQQGSTQLSNYSPYEKTVEALLTQLKELRKYSEQIGGALGEFEDKLLKMEEVLSANSLWN